MAKEVLSDDEFNKHVEANKFVLAIFMDSDTEMDVSETRFLNNFIPNIVSSGEYPRVSKDAKTS